MDQLAQSLSSKLVLIKEMSSSSKMSGGNGASKESPPSGNSKHAPVKTDAKSSPEKSNDENGVPVSSEGVNIIYEDVINRLTRVEAHARLFMLKMLDINLGSAMKGVLTSDPPATEMLLLFEQVAAAFNQKKRQRYLTTGTWQPAVRARQPARILPKRLQKFKGKQLLTPKIESSSDSDFQSPVKLKRCRVYPGEADDSSVEILGDK